MDPFAPTTFRYREAEGRATITLDRPDRLNALTFEVYAELSDLFAALGGRADLRVVVVTGEGRGFCSGGDVDAIIGELLTRDMAELRRVHAHDRRAHPDTSASARSRSWRR